MIRLFLIVLAWPLVVVALVSGYQWYRAAFPEPPEARLSGARVDYPQARLAGREALDRFVRLAPAEQEAVIVSLARAVVSPERWLRDLNRVNYGVLCVGEIHEPDTRAFLAESFFSRYPVDRLLLEARPPELRRIEQRIAQGRAYTPLLDADIGAVIREARNANPDVRIRGIEETGEQYRDRQTAEGSRDRSLAQNFWRHFRPGETHVVLYGALHCADEPGWLYRYLRTQAGERRAVAMRNIQVLGEYHFEPLRAFLYFLDRIGIAPGHFVIEDTGRLHPLLRDWFALLDQQVLSRYDTLVVFRDAPAGSGGTVAGGEAGTPVTGTTRSAVHRVRRAVP